MNELHRSIHLRGWSFHNNADEAYKCKTPQNTPSMHRQVRVKFQLESPLCLRGSFFSQYNQAFLSLLFSFSLWLYKMAARRRSSLKKLPLC